MPLPEYKNSPEHIRRARKLRKEETKPEWILWDGLTAMRKQTGLKFRRQHPLYPYIVDFACIKARLIVELDGLSHDLRMAYDARREKILRDKGWTILRFNNEEVLDNSESVLIEIINKAQALMAALP